MFFLISIRNVYISLNGTDNKECFADNTCNYLSSINEITKNSNLIFNDFEISKKEDLLNFHKLFHHAIQNNCNIDGNNMIINGTELEKSLNFFLFLNNLHFNENKEIEIKNIQFIKFSETVLSIRNTTGIIFNNLQFKSCSNDRKISTISIVSSNLVLNNIQIIKSTSHDSSIISIIDSHLSFLSANIYQNFVFHESKQPMFMIIKSNITFIDSLFMYNTSPISPFLRLEELCDITLQNNTFYMNKHAEIILSDGYFSKTTIKSCKFDDNHGIIFISSTKASLILMNNNIRNSCSFDYSLISIFNSSALIENNIFYNCAGFNLIHSTKSSIINLQSNKFINCKPYTSIYHSSLQSNGLIANCSFINTISKHSVLYIEKKSKLNLVESKFDKSWSPILYILSKSDVSLWDIYFYKSYAAYQRAIYGSKSNLTINKSTFHDKSLKGLISFSNGTISLNDLAFIAPQHLALNEEFLSVCSNCEFGTFTIQNDFSELSFLTILTLIFIFVICYIILRKRQFRTLFSRSSSKNID